MTGLISILIIMVLSIWGAFTLAGIIAGLATPSEDLVKDEIQSMLAKYTWNNNYRAWANVIAVIGKMIYNVVVGYWVTLGVYLSIFLVNLAKKKK